MADALELAEALVGQPELFVTGEAASLAARSRCRPPDRFASPVLGGPTRWGRLASSRRSDVLENVLSRLTNKARGPYTDMRELHTCSS